MSQELEIKLLPCPCCGTDDIITHHEQTRSEVICTYCDLHLYASQYIAKGIVNLSENLASEKWNKRITDENYRKCVEYISMIANAPHLTHLTAREQAKIILDEIGELKND